MEIKKDCVVEMDYKLMLDSGDVIDSSESHKEPLRFLVGHNQIIPGLEDSLLGMKVGEKMSIMVPAEGAYGKRDENRKQTISRKQ